MPAPSQMFRRGFLKRLWRNIHLWLGISLFILLVPISLSGAILVYHDDIDEYLRTPKGAVAPSAPVDLALAVTNAKAAAGPSFQPTTIRLSEDARAPVIVQLRGQPRQRGERAPFLTAYIDPNDSRTLSVENSREGFFGIMHVLHGNLLIPLFYGRDIVGWCGVAMLILSLTGLYLWWPRKGQWSRAFAWRRSPATSSNLHYLTGFWICFPLALVSLTGIYISFPQQGRAVVSTIAEMSPPQQRGQGGPGGGGAPMANPSRTPNEILSIATARVSGHVDLIGLPNMQNGQWRVRVNPEGAAEPVTMMINDRSAEISIQTPPGGDRIASWMRWLHEGSHSGEIWRFIVFLTGIVPTILGVTGIMIWLRQRRQRNMVKAGTHTTAAKISRPAGNAAPAE